MQARKIFINGRFLTQPITGVQRFAIEILTALDKLCNSDNNSNFQIICLTPQSQSLSYTPNWNNILQQECGIFQGNTWEQFDLPRYSRDGLLLNLCNIGPVFHFNQIVVMHDASVFTVPETYSFSFKLKYRAVMGLLGIISKQIITVSDFSKNEISKYLKIRKEKIKVIVEGCDHVGKTVRNDSVIKNNGLSGPFFLIVGSASKHKNVDIARKAVESGLSLNPKLVIAGGTYSKVFNKETAWNSRNVIELGYISDEELKSLYTNATAFIFPSLYEGFGLPPIEAMACGCPVICSNRASLPEVCGDAAIYFDPTDVGDLKNILQEVLEDDNIRQEMRIRGGKRSELYTWKNAAEQLLNIIRLNIQ